MNYITTAMQKTIYSYIKRCVNLEHVTIAFLFGIAIFAYSKDFIDKFNTPKYYFTQFFFFVTIGVLSMKFAMGKKILIDIFAVSVIITIICGIEAIYTILQYFSTMLLGKLYPVKGHFDNPAGLIACLCAGLPFVLYLVEEIKSYRLMTNLIVATIFVAIVLSASRAGIIIALILILNSLLGRSRIKKYKFIIILIVSVCLIIVSYYLKTQSADGRILIWRSSLNMALDTPVIGYGLGGFRKLYMDYQASFLSSLNNEEYNLLADNTLYPFNEFINLYLCFGIVGWILFSIIILLIGFGYKKSSTVEKKVALSSLFALGFISFFSYPFKYPFTYLICIFNMYILIKDFWAIRMAGLCRTLAMFLAIGCIPLTYIASERIVGEYKWKQAYDSKNMDQYKLLLPILGNNSFFLYNYSAELFQKNRIDESLEIAQLCRSVLSSYDLELLLGDIYFLKQDHKLAERHYINASKMCPCRFIPLNQLYDLYKITNDEEKAMAIAEKIVHKPIKVKSKTVDQIKYKMSHALGDKNKMYNQN